MKVLVVSLTMFLNIWSVLVLVLLSTHSAESQETRFGFVTDSISPFREDYKYVAETKTYYKEHKNAKTWSEAVATCKAEGALLATPLTAAAARVLRTRLTDNTWLGINDLFAEGNFRTLNGTSVSDIYVNWRSGEPNDADDDEDCVVMYKDGIYNDDTCEKKFRFVCTKHQSEIEPYTACETTDQKYFLASEVDRCYKLHTILKNWHEAYDICLHEKAQLAIINSAAEADLLVFEIKTQPENVFDENLKMKKYFLGFSDLLIHGEFLTINGQTLEAAGYTAWADLQPAIAPGRNCGGMSGDGKLTVVNCDERTSFVCEKKLTQDISPQLIIPRFGG